MDESVGEAGAPASVGTAASAGAAASEGAPASVATEAANPDRAAGAVAVRGCDLCEAARMTAWYLEDEVCWIADCEICEVPMVVWRSHGAEPPPAALDHMLAELDRVAAERFGAGGFSIDRVMRQIPDHFHAHARDPGWWWRRFGR